MQRISRTFQHSFDLFRRTKTLHKCGHSVRSYFLTTLNQAQDKPLSNLALLRRKTGLPILKCKEALTRFETMDEAEVWLEEEARKEGMQRVSLGRDTANGVVALCITKLQSVLRATMIQISCETDHLSLGEDFQNFSSSLCRLISNNTQHAGSLSIDQMMAVSENGGPTVSDHINSFVGRAKENTTLSRGIVYECGEDGCLGSYVHNYKSFSSSDTDVLLKVGTHAAIVHVEGGKEETEDSDTQSFADQLAQHVVGIDQDAEGKVDILKGQPWLFDPDLTVKSVLDSKQLNCVHLIKYELRK